jgi:tetratricopeptide (TPR) repeat protein
MIDGRMGVRSIVDPYLRLRQGRANSIRDADSATVLFIFVISVTRDGSIRADDGEVPNFWRTLVGLGRCYEARGDHENAITCFERATAVSDNVPTAIGALGRAYAMAGKWKEVRQLLSKRDNLARHRYVSPYGRVLIYLGLKDAAVFDWLERSCNERAGWLMYLATDPRFDSLRGGARFQALLDKLHIPKIEPPADVSAPPPRQ